MNKKTILLVLIGVGIAAFYFFDIQQYLSFESLKANRDRLNIVYHENSIIFISGFEGDLFKNIFCLRKSPKFAATLKPSGMKNSGATINASNG